MIEANELRIGNHVLDNGILRKVTGIKLDDLGNRVRLDDAVTNRLTKNIEPIHLTPELLKDFGFTIFKNEMQAGGVECKLLISGEGFDRDATWFSSCGSFDGFQRVLCICKGNYFGNNLQYLHEVQNLYFFLTGGKELPVGSNSN